MITNPITKAIRAADPDYAESIDATAPGRDASPRPLAGLVGVSYQAVRKWESKGRPPAERALQIEQAVRGTVTRHQLRPDIYPPEEIGAAATAAQERAPQAS